MEGGKSASVLRPVVVTSLTDDVLDRLEDAIVRGELAAGSALNEVALAKLLGVSRIPVREALRRLQGRRLVEWLPNSGPQVLSISQDMIVEVFVVREALEGMAARLAAERITKSQLADLAGTLKRARATTRRGTIPDDPDLGFHALIAQASGNAELIELLTTKYYTLLRIYRHRSASRSNRVSTAYDEHSDILHALKRHDPDAAESAMRRHIARARKNLEEDLAG